MKTREQQEKSLERVRALLKLTSSPVEEEAQSAAVHLCRIIRENEFEIVLKGGGFFANRSTAPQTNVEPTSNRSGPAPGWGGGTSGYYGRRSPVDDISDYWNTVRNNVNKHVPDPPKDPSEEVELITFTKSDKATIFAYICQYNHIGYNKQTSFEILDISSKALKILLKSCLLLEEGKPDYYGMSYSTFKLKGFIKIKSVQTTHTPYSIPCGVCTDTIHVGNRAVNHRGGWLHPFCARIGMDIFDGVYKFSNSKYKVYDPNNEGAVDEYAVRTPGDFNSVEPTQYGVYSDVGTSRVDVDIVDDDDFTSSVDASSDNIKTKTST